MTLPAGVELHAPLADKYAAILTPEALTFAVALQREFNATRKQLLAARVARQQTIMVGDSGVDIETAHNAGVRSCGVTYGFQPETFAKWPPDILVDRLEELADQVLVS